jgi:hypothetical protein
MKEWGEKEEKERKTIDDKKNIIQDKMYNKK